MNTMICFHKPEEPNGYLSNWYLSDFSIDGTRFSSMEQYMMYSKACTFCDARIAARILQTDDVAEVKQLGRLVQGYQERVWNGLRQIIVYRGLLAKFSQNEQIGKQLRKTGDAILAECAVSDLVWGIGLSMHDPNRFDISKWCGQGLLGFALMQVRDSL